jgi:hypothetical protein
MHASCKMEKKRSLCLMKEHDLWGSSIQTTWKLLEMQSLRPHPTPLELESAFYQVPG